MLVKCWRTTRSAFAWCRGVRSDRRLYRVEACASRERVDTMGVPLGVSPPFPAARSVLSGDCTGRGRTGPHQAPVCDQVYDMAFVALNADHSGWHLTLDLCEQEGLTESETNEPLQTLLLSNLARVFCDGTTPMLAKREWILQLFEHGNVRSEPGSVTWIPTPRRSNRLRPPLIATNPSYRTFSAENFATKGAAPTVM